MTPQEYSRAYQDNGYRETLRTLKKYGVDYHLAEDLAQSAWLKGWQSLGQLRDGQRLNSWIAAIATNLMHSTFRRVRADQLQPAMEPAGGTSIGLDSIEIHLALRHCSPRQRRLLELIYIEGYSCTELAVQTGRSVDAIHAEVYRTRKALKRILGSIGPSGPPGLMRLIAKEEWQGTQA